MIRHVLIIALALSACSATAQAQSFPDPSPGSLLLGNMGTWYSAKDLRLCPEGSGSIARFSLWGVVPETPFAAVSFEVIFPDVSTFVVGAREIVYDGASDAGSPGDDIWDIRFAECSAPGAGEAVELVRYELILLGPIFDDQWICLSGPSNPDVVWTECSGGIVGGAVYPPEGFSYPSGCFTFNSDPALCAVEAELASWTSLKARY